MCFFPGSSHTPVTYLLYIYIHIYIYIYIYIYPLLSIIQNMCPFSGHPLLYYWMNILYWVLTLLLPVTSYISYLISQEGFKLPFLTSNRLSTLYLNNNSFNRHTEIAIGAGPYSQFICIVFAWFLIPPFVLLIPYEDIIIPYPLTLCTAKTSACVWR